MRLMAVAVRGDRYGEAQQAMTVRAPVMVETSWPRFAAPGDTFRVPIKLFNQTNRARRLRVSVKAEGPIALRDDAARETVKVEAGAHRTVWRRVEATGTGKVHVKVRARTIADDNARTLTARREAHFPVRHAAPLKTHVRFIEHEAGEPLTIPGRDALRADRSRREITVFGSPVVGLRPALRKLARYPHGCAEQTTSRLWALLWTPRLLRNGDVADATASKAQRYVRAGLDRLWSMQTLSGGIAYWPGETEPNAWASGYVGRFLAQAKRAGHPVEPRLTGPLLDYLAKRVRDTSGRDAPSDNARALYCRVLAAFDRAPTGWLATLTDRVDQLDMAGRAHLAAAWVALGRRDRARRCLPEGTLKQAGGRTTHGRITAPARQQAALLSALLELDPEHKWIPKLVQRLKAMRRDGTWGSTLSNATALAALAKYQLKQDETGHYTGTLTVAHGERREKLESGSPQSFRLGDATERVRLKTQGEGKLYVALRSEGQPKDGTYERYDRGLKVRRQWLNRAGEPINPTQIEVGDLIRVKVTIEAPELNDGRTLHNVAIVDALPGGLEIENPKLATSATFGEASAEPEHQQFRDDRVLLYTSVGSTKKTFRYAVRAVTPGSFKQPPVQASCMYDPGFASVSGGGRIEVAR